MWRMGTEGETYSTPEFESDTLEGCDKLAFEHFNLESGKLINILEGMKLVRIDSPAVEEKSTFLSTNGRQDYGE